MAEERTAARRNFEFQRIIAAAGAVLMIGKFIAYFLTSSVSILTDALESIVNVVAGCIGVYALWLSMQPADKSHPYGHGKVELISSSVEGTMIVITGLLIIVESVRRLMDPAEIKQLDVGLIIIIAVAATNFAMGMTAIRMGRVSNSIALEASGRHLCTDTYSSVGFIVGLSVVLVAGRMGCDLQWIDPAMALLFGTLIAAIGTKVIYRSFDGIMDRADERVLHEVVRCLNRVRPSEVIDIHHLRVTRYGTSVHIDAHMIVPGDLAVSRATEIRQAIADSIASAVRDDVDITIQAESCLGKSCARCVREGCAGRRAGFQRPVYLDSDAATDRLPPSWKG